MASGSGASTAIADGVAGVILPAVKEGHGRDYTPDLLRFLRRKAPA
jgi:hypothetical protein